ncbi:MAG: FixH family protein [Granulosicoccaceae bacterium]
MQETAPPPWYKQFWPWVLIGIPFGTVVACSFTIYLAIVSADGVVVDDYYKEGKAINQSKERDERAADRGLSAQLVRGDTNAVRVMFNQSLDEQALVINFAHATQDKDFSAALVKASDRAFDAVLEPLPPGKWYVQVEPVEGDWRLRATAYSSNFDSLSFMPGQ